jgi:hypothetical protein
MTTTAWAHLPNAKHIDRILASVEKNPEKWNAVWGVAYNAAYGVAWDAVWGVAYSPVYSAAQSAARETARYSAARGAILALGAWDDCAYMLELPEDTLREMREAGNEQAILLSMAANVLRETS